MLTEVVFDDQVHWLLFELSVVGNDESAVIDASSP